MSFHGAPPAFRKEVVEWSSTYGIQATELKYRVSGNTIRRWRKELGYPPLQRQARVK